MTQRTLEKLPHHILLHIEQLRKDYKTGYITSSICRNGSYNYTKALYDAGMITDLERRELFTYTTI